jgi:YegS/Rv2252/BmrU family lipid kinase
MTTALVIGRKRPGRPIRKAVRDTRQKLEAAGWTVESSFVKKKSKLRRKTADAVEAGIDVVVAVGGDGAVLQVVQSLAEKSVALGIIPMGTGNLVARNLGIHRRLDRAVSVLLEGQRRVIDLGHVTLGDKKWYFSVACGVGFDAEVMDATKTREKDRWGRIAYAAIALTQSGKLRNVEHTITVDGVETTMEAAQVFIANFGRTGLGVKPRLEVEPDDGVLDVIAIRASGRLSGLLAGWKAIRQGHEGETSDGRAFRAKAREIRIETKEERLVEIDGSVMGKTPIDVSVRPAALTVLVPGSTDPESNVPRRDAMGTQSP